MFTPTRSNVINLPAYWVTYTGDLAGKTVEQRKALFREILTRPDVEIVYLPALVAKGVTFDFSQQGIIERVPETMNVFLEFDEVRQEMNRRTVKAIAWIEAPNFTFPETQFAQLAREVGAVIKDEPDKNGVIHLDLLNPKINAPVQILISEIVQNQAVDGIAIDDHFGVPIDLKQEVLKRHASEADAAQNPDGWLKKRITNQVVAIKRVLENVLDRNGVRGKTFVISTAPLPFALKSSQDVKTWSELQIFDEWNVQLYYDNQLTFERELSQVTLDRAKVPLNRQLISVSIIRTANGQTLNNEVLSQYASDIRSKGFRPVGFNYSSLA